MDIALGSTLAGHTEPFPAIWDLPSTLPGMGTRRCVAADRGNTGRGLTNAGQVGFERVLYRRDLRGREKGGAGVGKTKRGKGTKLMAVADSAGTPIAIHTASASPHEITLIEGTIEQRFTADPPERLIGDRAYDSDPLDAKLADQGIELIAPHRANRSKARHSRPKPPRRGPNLAQNRRRRPGFTPPSPGRLLAGRRVPRRLMPPIGVTIGGGSSPRRLSSDALASAKPGV